MFKECIGADTWLDGGIFIFVGWTVTVCYSVFLIKDGWWRMLVGGFECRMTCWLLRPVQKHLKPVITFADDWIMSCGEICDVIKSGCERLSVCGLVQGFCNRVHHWLCFHKLSQYFVWWNFSERSQCGHFKPAVIPHQNQKKKIMILH